MSDAPAGWYPDPSAPLSLRYWDGAAWTEHVAPGQGAAPAAYVAQPGPTTPDGEPLASWGMRLLAYIIDGLVVGAVGFVVGLPQQIDVQRRIADLSRDLQGSAEPDFDAFWHGYFAVLRDQMVWQVPIMLLGLAYFAGMLRWKGATLGKLAVGLRVRLRSEPGRLPWSAIAIRVAILNGLGVVPVLLLAAGWWKLALLLWLPSAIFIILDLLWPLWDSKRQALHDKAARTNVVKIR